MDRDRRASLAVGVFVMASLGVLAAVILTLSSERGLWKPHYRLVTYFDNVQGLIPGAPIRLAGKDVGTVESVRFSELSGGTPPVWIQCDTPGSRVRRASARSANSSPKKTNIASESSRM